MTTSLMPCDSCRRHVLATERTCPFCGTKLAHLQPVAELRLVTRLDRSHLAAFGAVLTAAGIIIGCQEKPPAAVAIYGAPAAPAPSTEPMPSPAPPSSATPASPETIVAPKTEPEPAPVAPAKPTATARPANPTPGAPAAAYGAPPNIPGPGEFAPPRH